MSQSTPLFDRLLERSPTEREFDAGALLFRRGDKVSVLHLVLDGEAHLVRHRTDGGMLVLQRAAPKTVLAEASVFSERYYCDAATQTIHGQMLKFRFPSRWVSFTFSP